MVPILLSALLLLVLLMLLAAYLLFRHAALRKPGEANLETAPDGAWTLFAPQFEQAHQWLCDHTTEKIPLQSHDRLNLTAWYVPAAQAPRGTVIAMHGYRSAADMDFLPEVQFLHRQGYRVLLPCQRAHRGSEGQYICFGIKERFDCKRWVEYIDARFPKEPIFLAGISMGAATVLMAAGCPLPETVRGIIADCGFTSPKDIMTHVAKRDMHLPSFPLLPLANCFLRRFAGYGMADYTTLTALKSCKLPILFIHGEADTFVPARMTMENYSAYQGEKELLLVPGAKHAQSYLVDPVRCEAVMSAFFDKHSPPPDVPG